MKCGYLHSTNKSESFQILYTLNWFDLRAISVTVTVERTNQLCINAISIDNVGLIKSIEWQVNNFINHFTSASHRSMYRIQSGIIYSRINNKYSIERVSKRQYYQTGYATIRLNCNKKNHKFACKLPTQTILNGLKFLSYPWDWYVDFKSF